MHNFLLSLILGKAGCGSTASGTSNKGKPNLLDRSKWQEPIKLLLNFKLWALPTALGLFLVVIAQINYLTFHTLAELFAIMVSLVMFALAWSTFQFSRNTFLLFLACGYLWIGALDLLHALVFRGMNLIVHDDGDISAQLWIGTRFMEALLLLLAPVSLAHKPNKNFLVLAFGAIAALLAASILSGNFPTAYVHGTGLTAFKINSEYAIIAILILALTSLFKFGHALSIAERTLIATSILFTICAELAFTFYFSVFGPANMAGHIFKIYSYWLIFHAIVLINLKKPYFDLMQEKKTSTRHLMQIQEQEVRLEVIFDNIPDGIAVFDMDHCITSVNRSMGEIFGCPDARLIGRQASALLAENGESGQSPQSCVELNGKPCDVQYQRCNGETFVGETMEATLNGPTGNPLGSIRIIRDVTEQKDLEEQLRRSHRMDAVGQLTGGIAHDFNNILGIVLGNLEMLQSKLSDNKNLSRRVEMAMKGAKRGAALTKKLLSFSRTESYETELTSINDLIGNMDDLLVKSLTVAINVERHLTNDPWLVDVDPGDLQDVILNLALNARDAMPHGGTLTFETSNQTLGTDLAQQVSEENPEQFVMLSVTDTGGGMTDTVREKAFEPFFSTKAEGKGSGLGLSMVYGFVKRSGGHITISSQPDKGTTIRIYLPKANKHHHLTDHKGHKDSRHEMPTGNETILIVDDEESIVEIAVAHLESLGYQTFSAKNGHEALEVLDTGLQVDLLFSDVLMPGGMSGYDLAAETLKRYPDIKTLMTSGFTGNPTSLDEDDAQVKAKLSANLLGKPYALDQLASAVRRILDGEYGTGDTSNQSSSGGNAE